MHRPRPRLRRRARAGIRTKCGGLESCSRGSRTHAQTIIPSSARARGRCSAGSVDEARAGSSPTRVDPPRRRRIRSPCRRSVETTSIENGGLRGPPRPVRAGPPQRRALIFRSPSRSEPPTRRRSGGRECRSNRHSSCPRRSSACCSSSDSDSLRPNRRRPTRGPFRPDSRGSRP